MDIIRIEGEKSFYYAARRAVIILKKGGIVVHPTDACYGIAADITNEKAVKKVFALKRRELDHPVNIIVKDREDFSKFGRWSPLIDDLTKKQRKRMYSFVVKKTDHCPGFLNPNFETVGIQIPKNPFSLEILGLIKVPLIATSANISGKNNVYKVESILNQIKDAEINPDLIIDGGALPYRKVSRVIEIIGHDKYRIVRN